MMSLTQSKSSVRNEGTPWQYIAMLIMYDKLTDTVIVSLTLPKSGLWNEIVHEST